MSEAVILVPLDGSEYALAALPVAKAFGEIEHATVHVVHVADESERPDSEVMGFVGPGSPEGDGLTVWRAMPFTASTMSRIISLSIESIGSVSEWKPTPAAANRLQVNPIVGTVPSREKRSSAQHRTISNRRLCASSNILANSDRFSLPAPPLICLVTVPWRTILAAE